MDNIITSAGFHLYIKEWLKPLTKIKGWAHYPYRSASVYIENDDALHLIIQTIRHETDESVVADYKKHIHYKYFLAKTFGMEFEGSDKLIDSPTGADNHVIYKVNDIYIQFNDHRMHFGTGVILKGY